MNVFEKIFIAIGETKKRVLEWAIIGILGFFVMVGFSTVSNARDGKKAYEKYEKMTTQFDSIKTRVINNELSNKYEHENMVDKLDRIDKKIDNQTELIKMLITNSK